MESSDFVGDTPAPYYQRHLFFCCNQRTNGRECCANKGARELRDYCKAQVRKLGLNGRGKVRVNISGCMDRCKEGPTLVVYPEGVWYSYRDQHDIDEIIQSHVVGGVPVERLRI
ncbi:MAG TPA: (2Fe-2S) ferredoxin domain-containing protein [Nevskiaceae bacterium]|nr:(2Fe-2S) ferredoxin domain-containing protein [Nevskiaceae bacterium]